MKYTVESLRQFGIQVAEKAGMSHQDAETLLKNLLFSDMRGVRSHGMTRLSGYVTRIERGCTSATAQPTITMDSGAVFSMDGNNGMGSTIGTAAMQACIRRAKEYGVSFCTVNHASHYGFGGFYAMQAAAEGMIGFNICNSPALVAPFGGATAMLGTNPLTVAVPSGKYPDLVLDMATSTVAKGKIALALKEGKSIPDNWALAPHRPRCSQQGCPDTPGRRQRLRPGPDYRRDLLLPLRRQQQPPNPPDVRGSQGALRCGVLHGRHRHRQIRGSGNLQSPDRRHV